MPRVKRLTATETSREGFLVETESGGDTYLYDLRVIEGEDDVVECVARTLHGEQLEPKATEAVREAMNERGYEVA